MRAKILIIEDDDNLRKTMTLALQDEGYEVKGAPDGKKALELSSQTTFDLIIADVRLPEGMDGIETVKTIKEMNPKGRIISFIMSGYADEDAPVRAIKVKADDYLYKPFRLAPFLFNVKKNLEILYLERQEKEYLKHIEYLKTELSKHNRILSDQVKKESSKLSLVYEISKEFSLSLKLDSVLTTIVNRVVEILGVDRCSILLFDEETEELHIAAAKGIPDDVMASVSMKKGEMISGWVLETREQLLIDDIEQDPRFGKANEAKYNTGSFISFALVSKDKAIGVINVSNKKAERNLVENDYHFIRGIADHAAMAIDNARIYTNLQNLYLQVVTAFVSAIDVKDHYTKNHSLRVTGYAEAIAEALEFSREDMKILKVACQLHDLGKIFVRDQTLTKPGSLSQDEWDEIKLHPLKAVEILKPLDFLEDVLLLIAQHHERYDGTGYPNGLKGNQIDIKARIITVADSFDAILSDRPYCNKASVSEAINELQKNAGSQFDPVVVKTFIKVLEKNPDVVKDITEIK